MERSPAWAVGTRVLADPWHGSPRVLHEPPGPADPNGLDGLLRGLTNPVTDGSAFQAIVRAATAANKAGGPSPGGPRAEMALLATTFRGPANRTRTTGGTTLG
jgi:hypothetical protein